MIARRVSLLFVLFSAVALADDMPVERPRISFDNTTGAWSFDWWGVGGRTYFIQHAEELANPTPWQYLPIIERGNDAPLSYGFWLNPTPPRIFLRVQGQDSTSADSYAADFDGDGISNGWEIEHGLDPFNPADAASTSGGQTYLQIYQQSLGIGADPLQASSVGLVTYTPRI